MEIIDKILPLIGVAIGALLTPLITSRMENQRIKKNLKPELVRLTYKFFNLRKVQINRQNAINLRVRSENLQWQEVNHPNIDEKTLANIKENIKMLNEDIQGFQKEFVENFHYLTEIESQIISVLFQIRVHFGEKKYNKFNTLAQPEIAKSNGDQNVMDYSKVTYEQLEGASKIVDQKVLEKSMELNRNCDSLINKFSSL